MYILICLYISLHTHTPPYIQFINYNEPIRPRVVATGDPDVYSLLWSSASSSSPILQWGMYNIYCVTFIYIMYYIILYHTHTLKWS